MSSNAKGAKDAVPRVAALQRSSELYLALLATLGAGLAITVGLVVTRALQARERMMRDYADRLEASNKDLDAFAGRVAHDLRAPLTTAKLTTELAVAQLARRRAPAETGRPQAIVRPDGRHHPGLARALADRA